MVLLSKLLEKKRLDRKPLSFHAPSNKKMKKTLFILHYLKENFRQEFPMILLFFKENIKKKTFYTI